ncbi:MAG: DUF2889 domain-containing protein [Alphaproteobacteria bacterium]|nr:DUF2889 domain-containing protein [Alphaproteobacteria bacterium]
MPLSPPVEREPVHDRTIVCKGWRRSDGMWDIEGHLVDTKSYAFPNEFRGTVEPGQAIHDMWLRLTIDETMKVHGAEASTDASPFPVCPSITPNFKRLEGLTIGAGWRKAVRERLGGVEGCTHLVELLGPLATVAYQTIFGEKSRMKREAEDRGEVQQETGGSGKPPRLLNTCHAFSDTGSVVEKIWPEWHRSEAQAGE